MRAPGVPPGKKDTSVPSVGDAGLNRLCCRTLGLTAQRAGSFHRQTEFPDKEAASIAEHRDYPEHGGSSFAIPAAEGSSLSSPRASSDVRHFFPPP